MLNLKRIVISSVVMLGVLSAGVVSVSVAAEKAKSYQLSLNTATRVGTQVLTAGDYRFRLEGANAIFTKQGNKTTFTTPAKLEASNAKFDHTTIHLVRDGDQPRITSIELGGGKDLLKLD